MSATQTIKFTLTINYEIDGEADDTVESRIMDAVFGEYPGVICVDDDYAILINSTEIEVVK